MPSWSMPPFGGATDACVQLAPSSSVYANSAFAPVVRFEMKVRPVDWSVTRIGSSEVMLAIDGLTSCHRAGPASGSAGVRFSGGVTRNTSPHELVRMFPVFGSKPMLNSPLLALAPEPCGGGGGWERGTPRWVGGGPPQPGPPPPPPPGPRARPLLTVTGSAAGEERTTLDGDSRVAVDDGGEVGVGV